MDALGCTPIRRDAGPDGIAGGRQRASSSRAPASPGSTRAAPAVSDPAAAGTLLASALAGKRLGDTVHFRRPLAVAGHEFTHAIVLREFGTGSGAQLLEIKPSGALFIFKLKDVQREHALMCAIRRMNRLWLQRGVTVQGLPVEAVTYGITPLGREAGLVEYVPDSKTLYELSQDCVAGERHLRVLRELGDHHERLDLLAATTVGYLTMGYALGVRDGHDDNLMVRSDGAFFRVDFEFAFGRTPEIDTPATFVPNAVAVALGQERWTEVQKVCRFALEALSGDGVRTLGLTIGGQPMVSLRTGSDVPAWDCLRCVPELGSLLPEARTYTRTLSLEAFDREVQRADQWSLSRAAKNAIREAVRRLTFDSELLPSKDWPTSLSGLLDIVAPPACTSGSTVAEL
mmetsp:Transcript_53084/g.119640  ORF Transcript_53084/g.119640 Transcript_53084/m.119640 type:complete len:401 (+) Transcript_53084:33-1235(+)|eukprot:CAMPEP_0197891926 /NCGR_PEP_ID=MMETSP1439-20131203/29870_1 /TAXON_ID=66791 /ORGANISM="Gonyaulax spinifera, Strain CCMP409" /LENGTH=400 /DNA_ID=CAMNT_0043512065 /DNA_START=30 /DNA_END=1232 /DNA_ORIENTATION=-